MEKGSFGHGAMSACDAVDGSHPPASKCQIAVLFYGQRMAAYGYKQTSSRPKSTSALPPKADVLVVITDFRL